MKRYNLLMHEAEEMIQNNKKSVKFESYPNATDVTAPSVPIP